MAFVGFRDQRRDQFIGARQRRASRPLRRRLTRRLSLEHLEDRRLLTVIVLQPKVFADTDANFAPFTAGPTDTIALKTLTLRDAVIEANYLFNTVNPGVANTIDLQAGTYTLSLLNTVDGTKATAAIGHETASARGDLNITGNLTFQGAGGPGDPDTTIRQKAVDRVFEVDSPGLTVNFNNLIFTGGTAVDDTTPGALPGTTTAEGGGIWATGDTLAVSNVTFQCDQALGGDGTTLAPDGQNAEGGGMWVTGGTGSTLVLTNVTFQGNSAVGGDGLDGVSVSPYGATGGFGVGGGLFAQTAVVTFGGALPAVAAHVHVSQAGGDNFYNNQAQGGEGGDSFNTSGDVGGIGGDGDGGAVYAVLGSTLSDGNSSNPTTVPVNRTNFSGNEARGGDGGNGGSGTLTGGAGGAGGSGNGGGLMLAYGGTITFQGSNIGSNLAQGGDGGKGGAGTQTGSTGGAGGAAGNGLGGGLVSNGAAATLTGGSLDCNRAQSGAGGDGGNGAENGGLGGQGGYATGGAILVQPGPVVQGFGGPASLTQVQVNVTGNVSQGGNGGKGGKGAAGVGGDGGSCVSPSSEGGGIGDQSSTVNITGGNLSDNQALGGNGGKAGTGGAGADGGDAVGGGLFAIGGTLTVTGTTMSHNQVRGGKGSAGGDGNASVPGGNGGNGGFAGGGGIYCELTGSTTGTVTLDGITVSHNQAQGGKGGKGGNSASTVAGGSGGNGGDAQAGGVFLTQSGELGTAAIDTFYVLCNAAIGGNGGSGGTGSTAGDAGDGGSAYAGGLSAGLTTVNVTTIAQIEHNTAQGGNGGKSGAADSGLGGDSYGGGVLIALGSLNLTNTLVSHNSAIAGLGFLGGLPATADGGGVSDPIGGLTQNGSTSVVDNSPNQISP